MRLPIALIASLALVACGGESTSTPDELLREGTSLAAQGDHAAALANFDEALGALGDEASPLQAKLQVAKVSSFAHEDPDEALDQFMAFAETHQDAIGKGELGSVASKLSESRLYVEAARIVDYAMGRFEGDSDLLDLRSRLKEEIAANASDAQLETLRGLGYAD